MRYIFTIVWSKWCIRQDFTTNYKLSKFFVNVEIFLPEVYMSSKSSNNFSIIYPVLYYRRFFRDLFPVL